MHTPLCRLVLNPLHGWAAVWCWGCQLLKHGCILTVNIPFTTCRSGLLPPCVLSGKLPLTERVHMTLIKYPWPQNNNAKYTCLALLEAMHAMHTAA